MRSLEKAEHRYQHASEIKAEMDTIASRPSAPTADAIVAASESRLRRVYVVAAIVFSILASLALWRFHFNLVTLVPAVGLRLLAGFDAKGPGRSDFLGTECFADRHSRPSNRRASEKPHRAAVLRLLPGSARRLHAERFVRLAVLGHGLFVRRQWSHLRGGRAFRKSAGTGRAKQVAISFKATLNEGVEARSGRP